MVNHNGYTHTEAGVIPSDWNTRSLGSTLGPLKAGVSVNSDEKSFQQYFILKTSAVHDGIVDISERKPVIAADIHRLRCPITANCIVISRMNTPALVGECGYSPAANNNTFLPDRLWLAEETNNCSFKWLNYLLNTEQFRASMCAIATGTSNSMKNIAKERLDEIVVPFPKHAEQIQIATALSDMDEYITALEKLITKKQNIKKGSMQELLTGKRRLPGFSGEWEDKPLVDYCTLITKQTGFDYTSYIKPALTTRKLLNTLPMIQTINFRGRKFNFTTDYYIPISVANDFPNIILNDKCILFSIVGASVGNIGLYPGGTSFCGGAIGITHFKNEYDVEWVYYYLCGEEGQAQIRNVTKGGAQATVTIADIRKFIIPTPEKAERTAIAAVLSDMDTEIDALTAKLNKAKLLKQGMMSELLTGHIRLVDTETPSAPALQEAPARIKQAEVKGHNHQFDDAVMIAGIVNALYSPQYPIGRKRVQKCLYLLRRHQDESTSEFKKKAAGPYADAVRYKGGEPIAKSSHYVITAGNENGTRFSPGKNIGKALGYIKDWDKTADIQWVAEKLKYKKTDDLELLSTVDMAICDLAEAGIAVSVDSIKHLITTEKEWKAKLKKQSFSDANIARAIKELSTLL